MDKPIKYTTTDEQLLKLKKQGLIINDEQGAKKALNTYGYSNLIKGYRDPYTYTENGKKLYRSGVTFEQILSLYTLDKNLRNSVLAALLDFEEYLKEAVANVVADSFGVNQDMYLKFENYRDKRRRKYRFSLAGILETMRETLETDRNPICHYSEKYGTVPPWILFKSLYFSTVVNFISLLKPREKVLLSSKLYNSDSLGLDNNTISTLMIDTLFICLEYRNLSAHGARIYNHSCSSRLRFAEDEYLSLHGFNLLLFILNILEYRVPYTYLKNALTRGLNMHCESYPDDITYLGQILDINITHTVPVYRTDKSKIYHYDMHCSGIKSPARLELTEALKSGLTACKRCGK